MNIIIYSTKTCAFCPMVKKFLTNKGFTYNEVDVTDDLQLRNMLQKEYGAVTVPITVFKQGQDKKWVIGWKPAELAAALV